jgi:hypothetical protein
MAVVGAAVVVFSRAEPEVVAVAGAGAAAAAAYDPRAALAACSYVGRVGASAAPFVATVWGAGALFSTLLMALGVWVILVVCLFVLFSFNVHSTRRGMWTMTKKTGYRPCVLTHTYEILHRQLALCAIVGVGVPLTK